MKVNKKFFKFISFLTMIIMAACAGKASDNVEVVSPAKFKEVMESNPNVYILDVRTPQEFENGYIPGSHLMNWLDTPNFKAQVPNLDKSKVILTYCRSGRRSLEAANYLASQGYKVVDLDGGFMAWEKAGYPVAKSLE